MIKMEERPEFMLNEAIYELEAEISSLQLIIDKIKRYREAI